MSKKLLGVAIAVCLTLSLIISGCAAPASTTPTATTPTATTPTATTPTAMPSGEVIHLTLFYGSSRGNSWAKSQATIDELIRRVEDGTDGKVTLDVFCVGEHPYKMGETLRAVSEGNCDITETSSVNCGEEPRLGLGVLPLLYPAEGIMGLTEAIHFRLRDEGYFKDIYDDWNCELLMFTAWGEAHIFTNFAVVTGPDVLKGKRLRGATPAVNDFVALMGAEPVFINWSEVFSAVSTGLVDGVLTSFNGGYASGLFDLCPYVTWSGWVDEKQQVVANKDSLAALPADVRENFITAMHDMEDWHLHGQLKQNGMFMSNSFYKYGLIAGVLPPEWREELREKAYDALWRPVIDKAGPEGPELYNKWCEAMIAEGCATPPGYPAK